MPVQVHRRVIIPFSIAGLQDGEARSALQPRLQGRPHVQTMLGLMRSPAVAFGARSDEPGHADRCVAAASRHEQGACSQHIDAWLNVADERRAYASRNELPTHVTYLTSF